MRHTPKVHVSLAACTRTTAPRLYVLRTVTHTTTYLYTLHHFPGDDSPRSVSRMAPGDAAPAACALSCFTAASVTFLVAQSGFFLAWPGTSL